jgi:ketosteroid isomerase-like protein
MTRADLEAAVRSYLSALDRLDLDATIAHFAQNATLTVQSAHLTVRGKGELTDLWRGLFDAHAGMSHELANVVVDEPARKVATEQSFAGRLHDGTVERRYSAYIFELDEHGRFSRVMVWIDGETPAGG